MAAAPPSPPPPLGGGTNGHAASAATFSRFFESWIAEQARDLAALRAAASAAPPTPDEDLSRLVDNTMAHYEHYYDTKAAAAGEDVLRVYTPSWTSATENLFLWWGGWRPAAALHLLYSKSGMQLESQLPALISGTELQADLGSLTAEQLLAADKLQRDTIRRERDIEEVAAKAQEALTTARMLELAGGGGTDPAAMEREIRRKMHGMERVLNLADKLRLKTMREVVALLRPSQAVHFLIAAAELHIAVHNFGRRRDGHGPAAPPPAAAQ